MKPKVYLAGPITGLTFRNCQSWRQYAMDRLAPEIQGFSPLRFCEHLDAHGVLNQSYDDNPATTDRGINTRDHWDVKTSAVVLCNVLDATVPSIGTVMEIAWAFAYQVPLVLAIASKGSVHEHPMIRDCTGFRTSSLDAAIEITKSIILPH